LSIQKIENTKQKIIITSFIVSDKFCEKIISILNENKELIYNSFSNYYKIILKWCIDYFNKYQKAPHNHIQDIFNLEKKNLKEDEIELVERFLIHLSDRFEREEKFNEDYIIDEAIKYLREINLNILTKKINEAKESNQIDEAEKLVLTFDSIQKQMEIKQETFLFKDLQTAIDICDFKINENEDDRLFKLNGELGEKLGYIYREDFMSILAPAKIGKSFVLREIALLAVENNLNVLIFNLEMSHKKYLRSFYQNICQEVKILKEGEVNKKIKIPYFELNKNNGKYDIKYEELTKFGLNSRKIKSVFKRKKVKSKGDIIVRSFSSNTLTFQKMCKILDEYVLDGFVVDVVLIDFLDNLKTFSKNEFRHSIDEKWTNARRLAQDKHIAVITVSHTNKKTFNKDIDAGDEVEDSRKANHITHSIGLNQTPDEKEKQIMRINIIHSRDEDFNRKEMFLSLECRDIGKVLIDTMNMKNVNYIMKKEK
jgi:desulfoferrodoxin (superoxide reductase-like protein)